jgi:hypothetical protein
VSIDLLFLIKSLYTITRDVKIEIHIQKEVEEDDAAAAVVGFVVVVGSKSK